jgi:hypothetical protein
MAKRPQVFDQAAFEESLRKQGCKESMINPISTDFKLFVPIALRYLGEEKLLQIMKETRSELKLGEQDAFWREAAKYIVGWAEGQIEEYKAQK